MIDDAGKFCATPNQVARSELALEYGVLQMIAVPAHGLEDFAQPLVVSDVVTNQIGLPHLNHSSGYMFRIKGRLCSRSWCRRTPSGSLQLGALGARKLKLRSAFAFSHGLTASIVFRPASAPRCPWLHASGNRRDRWRLHRNLDRQLLTDQCKNVVQTGVARCFAHE